MPDFLDPGYAEFWVGAGLLIFLAIVAWKGRGAITGVLDAKAAQISRDLDEAARLRAQAEAMLATLRDERAEAERRGALMLEEARAEAARLRTEAQAKLEARIARRADQAERRIARAEAEAAREVKAAAADLAARTAERVLARRVAEGAPDPLIDRAVDEVAVRLH